MIRTLVHFLAIFIACLDGIGGHCPDPSYFTNREDIIYSHTDYLNLRYPNGISCTWFIKGKLGKRTLLDFMRFDIEESERCFFDSLTVQDSVGKRVVLCGNKTAFKLMFHGSVTLRFTTDNNNAGLGFKIRFLVNSDELPKSRKNQTSQARTTLTHRSCGQSVIAHYPGNFRIMGGQEAKPGSWPWMVSLLFMGRHACGGSIIDKRWILTAAHCFKGRLDPSLWTLLIGAHDVTKNEERQSVSLKRIYVHDYYDIRTHDLDFALLHINEDIKMSERIQPICMAKIYIEHIRTLTEMPGNCYVTGWGHTGEDKKSNILKQAKIPMFNTSYCNNHTGLAGRLSDNMFCAGYSIGGHDSCVGDSGGPLVCEVKDVFFQFGIVSWGDGCADNNKPGVYADVRMAYPWIRRVLYSNEDQLTLFLVSTTATIQYITLLLCYLLSVYTLH